MSPRPVRKQTRSAKVDPAKLARVRRFLHARSDSDAIAQAIDLVEEKRLLREFIDEHGGKLTMEDFEAE